MTNLGRACLAVALCLASGARAADDPADEATYYRLADVALPKEVSLEVGGLGFSPEGTLYVCTRRGEVWARKGESWSLFASGLHEPLGLMVVREGEVVVAQRPELTRVRDTDRDGKADDFETLTQDFGLSGNYHEYHFGPVRDRKGNLYGTLNLAWEERAVSWVPYRGWMYKLTPQGKLIPFASGFRSPSGVGISPDGDLFVVDNQGDWVGTSPMFHVQQGGFYGHPAGLKWEKGYKGPHDPADLPLAELARRKKPPAVWFPYGPAGQSPSEPIWDTSGGAFGPFAGQVFVGDQTRSFIVRVALEKVRGQQQGAVIMFRRGFGSGITRMALDRSATLWVGGTDRGWGATGGRPFALQTLAWTGKVPFEIHSVKARRNGFELTFTKPVAADAARQLAAYNVQHYRYNYWKRYGSAQMDVTVAPVQAAALSADGRRVTLTLPPLVQERIYELQLRGVAAADGSPLLHSTAYYTLNVLP